MRVGPASFAGLPRSAEWSAPLAGLALAAAILRAAPGTPLPIALVAFAAAATGALAAWIVWQDIASFTISDAALLALAAIAFALRWSGAMADGDWPGPALLTMALDVLACGGILLLFRETYYRLKGVDGLGLGDVKLAAAGALLVGGVAFSYALLAASLAGLAAVFASRLACPGAKPVDRIAFGALLAPALWTTWLVEQALPRLGGG